jgi:hypothetical protein
MRTVYTWKYNDVSDQLKEEGGEEQKKNYHRRRRGRDSLAILAIRHGLKLQNALVGCPIDRLDQALKDLI